MLSVGALSAYAAEPEVAPSLESEFEEYFAQTADDADEPVVKEARLQPQPSVAPRPELTAPTPAPPQTAGAGQPPTTPSSGATPPGALAGGTSRTVLGATTATGLEAGLRAATDAGSLLGKSPSVLGVGMQRRTPIVNDVRSRGGRVGALAASGSYWVPARIDLDTVVSKFDAHNIDQITVIKGPFSALYGPGYDFIDFDLVRAPRYADGFEGHGLTGFDYQTNGQQWHGKQSVWGGSSDWGVRVDYDHRTGNDYTSGNDVEIPASYKSRELLTSLGFDLMEDVHVDFHYLRLDQTDVEFPGQAFDMNYLVTDGFDLELVIDQQTYFDRFAFEAWYNRTRFEGDNFRPSKRQQFPVYDLFGFNATTDVDSMSTGFRAATTWGEETCPQLTAGVDLRYLVQELNEISSGLIGPVPFVNANSPLPRSDWLNPGFFAETKLPFTDQFRMTGGLRVDWVRTDVIDDPQKLENLGTEQPQLSLAEILGTDEFDQRFTLALGYLTAERDLNEEVALRGAVGFGERAPNLTELYDAQSFMFLLQNGLNITTGDPNLKPEKVLQTELGIDLESDSLLVSLTGFHAWMFDYITFENTGDTADQVDLRFINTDLATRTGVEFLTEFAWEPWLTPFATLEFVEARDLTRNGDFATRRAGGGLPSEQVPGLPRGAFSSIVGGETEPLPGIPPLESRLGLRLHAERESLREIPRWLVEVSARVVDDQDRVAVSLRESPTPGFTVWDLRSRYQVTDNWLVLGGVENFTDRAYREHLDYRSFDQTVIVYRPGISFYVGSEVTY